MYVLKTWSLYGAVFTDTKQDAQRKGLLRKVHYLMMDDFAHEKTLFPFDECAKCWDEFGHTLCKSSIYNP